MSNIAVVFTGGTIGSSSINGITDVVSSSLLTDMYREVYGDLHNFEAFRPYDILSENILPENWNSLVKAVRNINFSSYDGIIITHGTDTLPYTSAVIGMVFGGAEIPIVMVSAGKILTDSESNGLQNFASAVELINTVTGGVYAVYSEKGENTVYLATRMTESDGLTDSFRQKSVIPFGSINNGKLVLSNNALNISLDDVQSAKRYVFESLNFTSNILYIKPYPGMDYDAINLKGKRAVLHGLYHSATASAYGDNHSLIRFSKRCKNEGVELYLCIEKISMKAVYESIHEIMEAGAKMLCGISMPAALSKLYISYNQNDITPSKLMAENIFFEHME